MSKKFRPFTAHFIAALLLLFCLSAANAQIISVSPAQNALHVPPATSLSVNFNQAMDAATINDTTFRIWGMQSGLHRGAIIYDPISQKVTLTPTQPFAPGEMVLVSLTNGIKTGSGTPLNKFSWHFRVAVKPSSGKFAVAAKYTVGNDPRSIFAFDADGDADLDFAVTHWTTSAISIDTASILKNNGDGTFQARQSYAVGNDPKSVFAADVDGDGDMDLVVVNKESISILKNIGTGIFQTTAAYPVESFPSSVFAADLDSDGDVDLAATKNSINTLAVFKNNGDGTFQPKVDYGVGTNANSVVAADWDGDGDVDLAAANGSNGTVSILKNNGDGTFHAKTDFSVVQKPRSIFAANVDGDGDIDLVMANRNAISIRKNDGTGAFQSGVTYGYAGAQSILAADLDGEGDIDLAMANTNAVSIRQNDGHGAFPTNANYALAGGAQDLMAADLDGDGDLDLAVTNSAGNTVSILINRGLVLADPIDLNFNQVSMGYPKDLDFKIYNYGAASANITTIASNNARFTVMSSTGFTLAAGDSAKITVRYAPTSAVSDTGTITVSISGFPLEKISVRGTGIPPVAIIAFSPVALNFGNVAMNKTSDLILTLSNPGVLDLSISSIFNGNPSFSITNGAPFTIQPNETRAIAVRFTPPFLGNQSDTLKIFSNDATNSPIRIPLTGSGVIATNVNDRLSLIPTAYRLLQNFPNPFSPPERGFAGNPSTTIQFETPKDGKARLAVYNLRGELVRTLVDGEMAAGYHQATFDAEGLASGIYFYRLEAGSFTARRKMVLGK